MNHPKDRPKKPSKMTIGKLRSYIREDLDLLADERSKIKPSRQNIDLRNYYMVRQAVLKEILQLL